MTTTSRLSSIVGVGILALTAASGPALGQSADVEELKRIILEQQRQLEAQQKMLETLRQQVEAIEQSAEAAKQTATQAETKADQAQAAIEAEQPIVSSGNKKVKLSISGQINRAINVAGDGDKTKAYFVDNDTSNSRIRAIGTGEITDDLSVGTQIEVAIAPNESSQVSQDNEDSGDFFDERKVEAWFDSNRFGRVTLGKGSTASDGTAEIDFSQTGVIMYAGVADIAAGLKFRQKDGTLTNVKVSNAFTQFDGLSRKNRLRYDTPAFGGFSLSGSVISNQRADAAVRWAGELPSFKMGAAAAIADPNQDNTDYRLDGSFAVLHEPTGLNLTLSSGFDKAKRTGNPANFYAKLGWLTQFFDFGKSAMGVDFTRSVNNPTPSDEGISVGGAFVQQIADYGTELYAQVRLYTLDRSGEPNVDDIVVGTVGTRVKF